MQALICYDTRNFSTLQVCEEIRKGMNIKVDIKKVNEISNLDYDLILIGSPIFLGKPMQSIINFIRTNHETLKHKYIAAFIICWAASTKFRFTADAFLEILTNELQSCNLIASKIFSGKLILSELKKYDQKIMLRIIDLLSKTVKEFNKEDLTWGDARNFDDAKAFGREIIEKAIQYY